MLQYYICDTETTGLSSDIHEIVQVSIIRCADRVQLSRDVKAEHPEKASPQALQVTNKTIADIVKGMKKEDAVELFHSFLEEDGLTPAHRVIVAHNESFDRRFLHSLWKKVGKKFPADMFLCTMAMSKQFAKNTGIIKPKVNLKAAMEMLKVAGVQRFHASSVDCQNTFLLWQALMNENVDYLSLIKKAPHVIDEGESKEDYSFSDMS